MREGSSVGSDVVLAAYQAPSSGCDPEFEFWRFGLSLGKCPQDMPVVAAIEIDCPHCLPFRTGEPPDPFGEAVFRLDRANPGHTASRIGGNSLARRARDDDIY